MSSGVKSNLSNRHERLMDNAVFTNLNGTFASRLVPCYDAGSSRQCCIVTVVLQLPEPLCNLWRTIPNRALGTFD